MTFERPSGQRLESLLEALPEQKTRAAEGIRTLDPELGKLVLYQLSYHR
jgi:hypothetical protein